MSSQQGLTPTARLQVIVLVVGLVLLAGAEYLYQKYSFSFSHYIVIGVGAASIVALIEFGWIKRTMGFGAGPSLGPAYTLQGWPAVLLSLFWIAVFSGASWGALHSKHTTTSHTATVAQSQSSSGLDMYRLHPQAIDTTGWKAANPLQDFTFKYPADWKISVGPTNQEVPPACTNQNGCTFQSSNVISPDYAATASQAYAGQPLAENPNATAGANIAIDVQLVTNSDPISNTGCTQDQDYYGALYYIVTSFNAGQQEICQIQSLQSTLQSGGGTDIFFHTSTSHADYRIEVYLPAHAASATKDHYYSLARAIASSFVLY